MLKTLFFLNSFPDILGDLIFFPGYNNIAFDVNSLLLEKVKALEHMKLFQMDFSFPCENVEKYNNLATSCYFADGVHLNEKGLARLARKYRHIISAATNNKL